MLNEKGREYIKSLYIKENTSIYLSDICELYSGKENISDLYAVVADRYNTTATKIEKALRDAIKKSYSRKSILIETFEDRRPTNKQLVKYICNIEE